MSFHAACTCLDLILAAKRGIADPAAASRELERSLVLHLEAHVRAYGASHVKPKHHWQIDMASQLARDGLVLDAFIIERIHLQVKALGL